MTMTFYPERMLIETCTERLDLSKVSYDSELIVIEISIAESKPR